MMANSLNTEHCRRSISPKSTLLPRFTRAVNDSRWTSQLIPLLSSPSAASSTAASSSASAAASTSASSASASGSSSIRTEAIHTRFLTAWSASRSSRLGRFSCTQWRVARWYTSCAVDKASALPLRSVRLVAVGSISARICPIRRSAPSRTHRCGCCRASVNTSRSITLVRSRPSFRVVRMTLGEPNDAQFMHSLCSDSRLW
mmetsp:Transcript_16942/g.42962  ORF Transcript_16942/g.42962 Transcript_16942/m.42962 type:complete len:202 (-) Transcript_16942:132-737(-)